MTDPHELLADTLRRRVLRGIHAGSLLPGDRLPSARQLAKEFDVDHRLINAADKAIAAEGIVELRPRGGVYVAARSAHERGIPPLPERWLAEVLEQGLAREIPGPDLYEWLRRCTETLRLRAVIIATTADQAQGLCRELSDDFGFEAEGFVADEVRGKPHPLALRRADMIITTSAHASWTTELAAEMRKPLTVIEVRPDLAVGEWALLLRRPVYAVVASAAFEEMLRRFFAAVPGVENLRVLVLGRDDLTAIPPDAPTYVTQGARRELGTNPLPGRVLPAARTISSESARELFAFIVRSNIEAMTRLGR